MKHILTLIAVAALVALSLAAAGTASPSPRARLINYLRVHDPATYRRITGLSLTGGRVVVVQGQEELTGIGVTAAIWIRRTPNGVRVGKQVCEHLLSAVAGGARIEGISWIRVEADHRLYPKLEDRGGPPALATVAAPRTHCVGL